MVLFSSSYLIFHWLSSPSSFSMFLLSASLSLERGGEVDMGVSPLRVSAESPPARPMPGEPVSEVLGSAFKALEPHIVEGTPILHSFGSWTPHPLHNCRCPGKYVQGVQGCGKVTRTPGHWLCLAKNLMFNCQIGPLFLFCVLGLPVRLSLNTWFWGQKSWKTLSSGCQMEGFPLVIITGWRVLLRSSLYTLLCAGMRCWR